MGRQLIERLLDSGHKVTSLGRSPQPELKAKGVDVHQIDLADRQLVSSACKGMDAVFHVAAKALSNMMVYFLFLLYITSFVESQIPD